jgi:Ni/Fe-hydrogenase subunit HybB-like protein
MRAPLVEAGHDDESLTATLFAHVWRKASGSYKKLLGFGFAGVLLLLSTLVLLVTRGIGVWGNNNTVGWGFDIINFVWWIGIGHAGTLISAILLMFQQQWRTSINRAAEAMTLFAVVCALMYPTFHTGRPWFDWWMLPYPSTLDLGPQFKSPLVWDVFAVTTYGTVSLLFWYVGLVPDLAALRDRSPSRAARLVYGVLALGWRGSARHWSHWRLGYLLLAALSTPLVLSVHSVVSFDFAVSQLPGWHTTVFPPYFVAGAVFSGFAMVVVLMLPASKLLGLSHVITPRHFDNMNKVILATGLMVTYGYVMEHFMAWYSGNEYEYRLFFQTRMQGPYAPFYWGMLFCNCIVPQVFWWPKARVNPYIMFGVALLVNVGMWLERFVIIVLSLHRDFLTSSWAIYRPTWVDVGMFAGSLALFFTCMLLFFKLLPAVAVSEVKELNRELKEGHA